MRIFIGILVLAILSIAPVYAQTATREPLDPVTWFSPDVNILSVEIIYPTPSTAPQYDNDARIVKVYDQTSSVWQEFPYPEEIASLESTITTYDDHNLLLSTDWNAGYAPDPLGQWILDTQSGEFSRPELICGRVVQPQGRGGWFLYQEARTWQEVQTHPPMLCHSGTRQQITLETDEYLDTENGVDVSPDGKLVLIFGRTSVYIYSFDDKNLLYLGDVGADEWKMAWWLGNEKVLVYATQQADMSHPWQYYYVGIPTEAESLKFITLVYKPGYITTRSNPERYEWVTSRDDECYLVQMYAEDGSVVEYPLGDLCEQGILLNQREDDRLILDKVVVRENEFVTRMPSSRLIRLNPYTGEHSVLLEGEIEQVMSITPDGRYASIILDSNGQIDLLRSDTRQSIMREKAPSSFELAIIDLQNGELLFQIPAENKGAYCYGLYDGFIIFTITPDFPTYPSGCIFSIGINKFVLRGNYETFDSFIVISDGQIFQTAMGQIIFVTTDAEWILTETKHEANSTISAYHPANGKTLELFSDIETLESYDGFSLPKYQYSVYLQNTDDPDVIQIDFTERTTKISTRFLVDLSLSG